MTTEETQFRSRLIRLAEDAAVQIRPLNVSMSDKWSDRRLQFQRGIIEDEDTVRWLETHADYWQPKERDYADYVRKLASTYKPAIDI